tara:strand:+ start:1027 stop:1356 length:330 start_codon:yes stop_codon:yes gene_type:complete
MIDSEVKQIDFLLNIIQDMNMSGDIRYRAYITADGEGFYFQHPAMKEAPNGLVMLYVEAYIEGQWTMIIDWKQSIQPNRSAESILLIFARELMMKGILMSVESIKKELI